MPSSSAGWTLGYGAPEMLDEGVYTNKCDVWSLGCVFYFMVMGKPPVSNIVNLPDIRIYYVRERYYIIMYKQCICLPIDQG